MILSLEGNVGSGKSTLTRLLSEFFKEKFKFLQEPVDDWMETKTNEENILTYYYRDPKRASYLFQMNSFISRTKLIVDSIGDGPIFTERSVYSDYHCFAKTCNELGTMNDMELLVYEKWFHWLVNSFKINITGYIYLKTNPEECLNRIKKRSRNGESGIELDYLKKLHDKHEEWLLKQPNVLVLDGNLDFLNNKEIFKSFTEKIEKFISENLKTKIVNIELDDLWYTMGDMKC